MDQNLETNPQPNNLNTAPNVGGGNYPVPPVPIPSSHHRKIWIIIVIIILAVLAVAIFAAVNKKYQWGINNFAVNSPQTLKNLVIPVSSDEVRRYFFTAGSGTLLLHEDSQQQGNVASFILNFVSGLTVTEAVTSYENLFKNSDWTYTLNKNNTDLLVSMHATNKDGTQGAIIRLAKNGADKEANILVIYYIAKKGS